MNPSHFPRSSGPPFGASSGFVAFAAAMAFEFRRIVEAGLILQVDSPDLALGRHMMYPDLDEDAFVRAAENYLLDSLGLR